MTTAKTYDRQTAKFLAVVGENMPEVSSDIMQEWIENPRALQQTLVKALCPQKSAAAQQRAFPTWRTLKVGNDQSMKDLSKALMNNGFRITGWAVEILKKITAAPAEAEIELVNVSVRELGFEEGATREQIYARARECGLGLIPAEAGPHLRLLYTDQPLGEWLLIGMEPIVDSGGRPRLFYLERDVDGHWLDTDCGTPERFWYAGYRWVFTRLK